MINRSSRVLVGLSCVCVLVAAPAHAQVAALGKGWLLDGFGNLTTAAGEVISGNTSIKGSSSAATPFNAFLETDADYIHFAANGTYTITASYRIISAGPNGFNFGFFSGKGSAERRFVPTSAITGAPGSTGTATLTANLLNYDDYQIGFFVLGAGAIVIDDIRVTDRAGRVVASENAEGPTVAGGPLNLQITDATSQAFGAGSLLKSAVVQDLNGDGYPESVLTVTGPRPSMTPVPITVVESSGRLRLAAPDFFPAGVPTVKNSPMTQFADLNGDGLRDIVFSEAGGDPFGAGRISVALNLGGGKFRDVSNLIPADQQNTRSYAIAVGDVLSDGHVSILLPDENDGANTALLRWNGGGFDEIRNWVPESLWKVSNLRGQSWMNLADFDNDGKQDLLVSGFAATPNVRIAFGASGGFSPAGLVTLPDGPWGHAPNPFAPFAQSAEVQPVAVADFNNDGLPDIFATERKTVYYPPGTFTDTNDLDYPDVHANGGLIFSDDTFQVLINQGSRRFVDRTAPNYVNLGNRTYFSLLPIDINNDGFLDVVGYYTTTAYGGLRSKWGTTFFLNDGTGTFQVVDGAALIGVTTTPPNGERWSFGAFIPTVVTPQRMEGVVVEQVDAGGTVGGVSPVRLNVYKVVASGGIGTGPGFADSAALGVPGFNEFYYLGHYPDAAAAVQAGRFRTGLDHYKAVGAANGYQPHAPTTAIPPTPPGSFVLTATTTGNQVLLSWAPGLPGATYTLQVATDQSFANVFFTLNLGTLTSLSGTLPPGFSGWARVSANAGGSASNAVFLSESACGSLPSPGGVSSSVVGRSATVSWNAVPGATSFRVEADVNGAVNVFSANVGNVTSVTGQSLPSGSYAVRVLATNACAVSPPSAVVFVVP